MGRPVVHWELWSPEPEKVASFYAEVFGWSVRQPPGMEYRLVETGGAGGINGGIMKPKPGPWPGNMAFNIDVEDLAECTRRIVAASGRMVVEREEIPGFGSFALFADPDGRVMGAWQRQR